MYAGINLLSTGDYIRVNKLPVLESEDYKVYEFVESAFPNEIKKTVNGRYVGSFWHVALHANGECYLFDVKNKELSGSLGVFEFLVD